MENQIKVELWDVDKADETEILNSIASADAVFVGSSTKYADMTGKLEDLLQQMQKMNLKASWLLPLVPTAGAEAIEVVQDYLNGTNMKVQSTSDVIKSTGMTHVEFPVRIRFSPTEVEKVKKIKNAAEFVSDLLLSVI